MRWAVFEANGEETQAPSNLVGAEPGAGGGGEQWDVWANSSGTCVSELEWPLEG